MCSVNWLDLQRRLIIRWRWKDRPWHNLFAFKLAVFLRILLILVVISSLAFHVDHIKSCQFFLIIHCLNIIARTLKIRLIHLHFVHHHLHFVVFLEAVAVHFRKISLTGFFKLSYDWHVIVEGSRNWRFDLRVILAYSRIKKASYLVFLDSSTLFIFLLQITLDFQSNFLCRFLNNIFFRNPLKWTTSTILRFDSVVGRSTPRNWLVLRLLQELSVKKDWVWLLVARLVL